MRRKPFILAVFMVMCVCPNPPVLAVDSYPALAALSFADCEEDDGYVAPVKESLAELASDPQRAERFAVFFQTVGTWPGAKGEDTTARTFALLNVAALVDMSRGEFEAELARAVFDSLIKDVPRERLIEDAATITLQRYPGKALTVIPELGLGMPLEQKDVQTRTELYAKKLLGRLLGKLPASR
jgi:hypothetical protein